MSLLVLAAAAGFACAQPTHHDGDAIHCAGNGRSMRMYGIDAPEMPGACRPRRRCTPGDPYASRDYLAGLTDGRRVACTQKDTDVYGRRVVRCTADGAELSCAMVAAGMAVERYGRLDCGGTRVRRSYADATVDRSNTPLAETLAAPAEKRYYYDPEAAGTDIAQPGNAGVSSAIWAAMSAWLGALNIGTYAAFAVDKRRAIAAATRRVQRIPESTLLMLAAAGGSFGAISAQQRLRHKTRKQPFANRLLVIAGLQIGIIIAIGVTIASA